VNETLPGTQSASRIMAANFVLLCISKKWIKKVLVTGFCVIKLKLSLVTFVRKLVNFFSFGFDFADCAYKTI